MNTARSEQTCLDDAERWKQLLDNGTFRNLEDIANHLGTSVPTVSKTLSISTIPVRLLTRMREHKATYSLRVAVEIARIFGEKSPRQSAGGRELSQDDLEQIAEEVIDEAVKKELPHFSSTPRVAIGRPSTEPGRASKTVSEFVYIEHADPARTGVAMPGHERAAKYARQLASISSMRNLILS